MTLVTVASGPNIPQEEIKVAKGGQRSRNFGPWNLGVFGLLMDLVTWANQIEGKSPHPCNDTKTANAPSTASKLKSIFSFLPWFVGLAWWPWLLRVLTMRKDPRYVQVLAVTHCTYRGHSSSFGISLVLLAREPGANSFHT